MNNKGKIILDNECVYILTHQIISHISDSNIAKNITTIEKGFTTFNMAKNYLTLHADISIAEYTSKNFKILLDSINEKNDENKLIERRVKLIKHDGVICSSLLHVFSIHAVDILA